MDSAFLQSVAMLPITGEQLNRLAITIGIVIVLRFFAWIAKRTGEQRISDVHRLYNWRKLTSTIAHLVGILIIARLWIEEFRHLLTLLGIVSVGLAIAYKETVMNLTGGIFILWNRVFREGDRIQIGPHHGDVIGFGLFYFTLMEVGEWVASEQSTGRIISVPNSLVITMPIVNYNRCFPYIWNEIPVRLTTDSDRRKAEAILLDIASRQSEPLVEPAQQCLRRRSDEVIIYRHLEPAVYLTVRTEKPAGIILTLRYLCEPRQRRNTEHQIWSEILDSFARESDITLAFEPN